MKIRSSTLRHLALALVVPAAMAACDDDPTGPDGSARGSVQAEVHDGSSSSQAAAAPMGAAAAQSSASGTFSGSAQAYIYSEAQGWVALGSASSTTVAMGDAEGAAVGSAQVDADSYTRVRLVLDGFDADLEAGSTLGALTLDAAVSITMGGSDGRVEIEKSVQPFTVNAESNSTIRFDLNSESWVDQESAESRSASDAEIRSATTAVVTAG